MVLAEAAGVGYTYGVEGRRASLQSFDGTSIGFVVGPSARLAGLLESVPQRVHRPL
jgi:hypothetical protein